MRCAQIRKYDVANGVGIRTTVFVSGCTHNCKNCFNKLYQDFDYGEEWTEEKTEEIIGYLKEPTIRGLSILGGEPFQNAKELKEVVKDIKREINDKDIWIWSGYTYEEILEDEDMFELLKECDVLIDGRYVEELKNLSLRFRGSENQRIIDVKKTLENNFENNRDKKIVEWEQS